MLTSFKARGVTLKCAWLLKIGGLTLCRERTIFIVSKIVSEYDQEIPQSQTADNPMAPRGRAIRPSRDTRKTNLSTQRA